MINIIILNEFQYEYIDLFHLLNMNETKATSK